MRTDGKINGMARFLSCQVKVVFDDSNHVTIKYGLLVDADEDYIFIKTSEGEQAISKSKIVRVEKC